MSLKARVRRLEAALGNSGRCSDCGRPHIESWVQLVRAAEEETDDPLCACEGCGCAGFLKGLTWLAEGEEPAVLPEDRKGGVS